MTQPPAPKRLRARHGGTRPTGGLHGPTHSQKPWRTTQWRAEQTANHYLANSDTARRQYRKAMAHWCHGRFGLTKGHGRESPSRWQARRDDIAICAYSNTKTTQYRTGTAGKDNSGPTGLTARRATKPAPTRGQRQDRVAASRHKTNGQTNQKAVDAAPHTLFSERGNTGHAGRKPQRRQGTSKPEPTQGPQPDTPSRAPTRPLALQTETPRHGPHSRPC